MPGWVKIHRDLDDHWLWNNEKYTKGQAWIDLIWFAHFNPKPKKLNIKGKIYTIHRGQQARSEVTLSKKWGWSRNKVRRFLETLKNEQMIEQHPDRKTSIITICNYDLYQSRQTTDETTDETTLGTTGGQHSEHNIRMEEWNNERNNIRGEEKSGSQINNGTNVHNNPDSNNSSLKRGEDTIPSERGLHVHPEAVGGTSRRSGDSDNSRIDMGVTNGTAMDNPGSPNNGNVDHCNLGSSNRPLDSGSKITGGGLNGTAGNVPDSSVSGSVDGDDVGNPGHPGGGNIVGSPENSTVEGVKDVKPQPEVKDKGKPAKGKKNGKKQEVIDFSKVDPLISKEVILDFAEHRRKIRKPINTQRTLTGISNSVMRCHRVHGASPDMFLKYAMEKGWQTITLDYLEKKTADFKEFIFEQTGARAPQMHLTPLEQRNKENARIATEIMEKMFDEQA